MEAPSSRAKKEDYPKLMCCKVLLTVEGVVDLRIPRCRHSLTTSLDCPRVSGRGVGAKHKDF